MVKLTYDERNPEHVQLIDDYFWFIYQLEVIEFDIIRNEQLVNDIVNTFNMGLSFCYKMNLTELESAKKYIVFHQMKDDIMNQIYQILNKDDFKRFSDLYEYVLEYRMKLSHQNIVYNDNINMLFNIISIGVKNLKKEFKQIMILNFRDK